MATRNLDGEFDTVKDDLSKLRNDIANLSSALKDVTSQTVQDQLATIRHRVDSLTGEAKARSRETLDDITGQIEERPLASMLVAFGVGVLIGKLLDR